MNAKRTNSELGQTIVIAAFFILGAFGLFAVVLDVGGAWLQRRNLQNTADAAALAGAQLLNGTAASETPARNAATDYANDNPSSLDFAPEVVVTDNYTKIRVQVTKTANSFFLGTFGIGDNQIAAHAVAVIRSQNLPGKGVVPIGVEKSDYDALAGGGSVVLKEAKKDASSNTGLIKLTGDTGDEVRDGLKWGSDVPLQPTLGTKNGGTLGQVTQNNNSGLPVRLTAAINYAQPGNPSKHCYSWLDVQPPLDPTARWACSPFNALVPDGSHFIQATAVILVPIIVEDFTQMNGCQPPCLHVQPTAGGDAYLLAYFWIDGDATFKSPPTDYGEDPGHPKGQILGRFMTGVPTQLSEFDPSECVKANGCDLVDYDPQAVIKVVQLVE